MHRVKVTVVEEALDANNTIATANRADFDRHGVRVINFMSAPGARRRCSSRFHTDWTACVWGCWKVTFRARWTPTGSLRCTCR
jgi:hypothetical protein